MGVFRGAIDEMLGGAFRGHGIDGIADAGQLGWVFLQEAIGDHELDVRGSDFDLLKAVLHAAQAVGDVGKTATVEDGLLHTGHEAEAEVFFADLADFPEETKVENPPALIHAP